MLDELTIEVISIFALKDQIKYFDIFDFVLFMKYVSK